MQSPVPGTDLPLHRDRLVTSWLGSRSSWRKDPGLLAHSQAWAAGISAEGWELSDLKKDIGKLVRVQWGPPWLAWGVAKGVGLLQPGDEIDGCGGISQQPPGSWGGDWKGSGHKLKKESFQLGISKIFFSQRSTECWAGYPEKLWSVNPWRFWKLDKSPEQPGQASESTLLLSKRLD